jgi:hypothetical protein
VAPFLELRRPLQPDQQAAERSDDVGTWCTQHNITNNAGPTTVTVVQMRGAGDGNRTHVTSLEGWRTTIVLRPRQAKGATGRAAIRP